MIARSLHFDPGLPTMLYVSDIAATLQTHCAANAPADLPIVYPGVPRDVSRVPAWCEFRMTAVDDRLRREHHPDTLSILVDLHCFSRDKETRRIDAVADLFRHAFAGTVVPIVPHGSAQTVGLIRFREAALRELSRGEDGEPRLPIRHLVVFATGVAEETPA